MLGGGGWEALAEANTVSPTGDPRTEDLVTLADKLIRFKSLSGQEWSLLLWKRL